MPCGKCARISMYRLSRWGASRLWAAAVSSLPAPPGFSPSAGGHSFAFSLASAAHARPCALTLDPPGFVLLCGRARPATLPTCAGVPHSLAFPPHLCAPLRSAHTLAGLPPCALRYAPRAHPSPASMELQTVGCRGSFRCRGGLLCRCGRIYAPNTAHLPPSGRPGRRIDAKAANAGKIVMIIR